MRVAHPALDRLPRSVDPVAVVLPRGNTGHETVPDVTVDLGESDPRFFPGCIEQAEVHPVGDFREESKISAPFLPCSAKRIWGPWPDAHLPSRLNPGSPQPGMPHSREPDL